MLLDSNKSAYSNYIIDINFNIRSFIHMNSILTELKLYRKRVPFKIKH